MKSMRRAHASQEKAVKPWMMEAPVVRRPKATAIFLFILIIL